MTTTEKTTPDLLGMTYAHRMMRLDLRRFTELADRLAAGEACGDRRAAAVVGWLRTLSREIHHHHTVEDDLVWPLIERSAGTEIDLGVLTDDHRALDPLLARLDAAVTTFERSREAADLAAVLREIRDELDEHIEAEELAVFPVVERYVSAADWAAVEKRIRKDGPPIAFVLPRFEAVMRPEERGRVREAAGPIMFALFGLFRPAFKRKERLVFG
jgi:hemerythrin-like domain-containing protein